MLAAFRKAYLARLHRPAGDGGGNAQPELGFCGAPLSLGLVVGGRVFSGFTAGVFLPLAEHQ